MWVFGVGVLVLLATIPDEVGAYSVQNVAFEVASAQSNVGLTSGFDVPELGAAPKVMLMLNMWIGRLELIPILVFFRVLLWQGEAEIEDEEAE